MRAIIWKEIRENLKWAILSMLAIAAVMVFLLRMMADPNEGPRSGTLLSPGFQVVMVIGAIVTGSLFGLVQSLPETRRDQWAFLIHRPITASGIFLGKIAAGLGLYLVALLLPFLGSAAWLAMPGHVAAPFAWGMLLPGIADILTGIVFYFAGMLTGIRQARWYASRALPFVGAGLCVLAVTSSWEFWHALLVIAFSGIVLGTAAWGSFVASGQYRSQPAAAKPALGFALLVGILCVGFVASIIVGQLIYRGPSRDRWTRYHVDKQGQVLRVAVASYDYNTILAVTDPAGNPLPQYKGQSVYDLQRKSLLRLAAIRQDPSYSRNATYRSHVRFAELLNGIGLVNWFYVAPQRQIVGYENQSRQYVDTITPAGFSAPGAASAQLFPDERPISVSGGWNQTCLLTFPAGVYHIDLEARQAQLLVEGTADQPVLGASQIYVEDDWSADGAVGVVTASRIWFIADPRQPPVSVVSPYPPREFANIQAGVMPAGGFVVWYQPDYQHGGDGRTGHVVRLSAAGEELGRVDLPRIDVSAPAMGWPNDLWALIIPIAGVVAVCVIGITWVWMTFGYAAAVKEIHDLHGQLFGPHMSFWLLGGVVLLIGAIFWALMMVAIARRYAFTRRQTFWWAVAGFFLGPAGVLTLLCLRDWPARVACLSCRQMRVVDREHCEHCAAPFLPAVPTGIEIFDEQTVAARL